MDDDLKITERFVVPLSEISERFSRSGGPGGQHVNTSDSRVELSFDAAGSSSVPNFLRTRLIKFFDGKLVDGVFTVAASEYRSQFQNRMAARRRLVELLTEAAKPPPPPRRATKPSRGAQRRRLDAKRIQGDKKQGRKRPTSDD